MSNGDENKQDTFGTEMPKPKKKTKSAKKTKGLKEEGCQEEGSEEEVGQEAVTLGPRGEPSCSLLFGTCRRHCGPVVRQFTSRRSAADDGPGERPLPANDDAPAYEALAAKHLSLGELHPALNEYERALALRAQRQGEEPALVDTLLALTLTSIRLQQFERAHDYLERARHIQDSRPSDDIARARTLELRGLLERWQSQYAEALRDLDAAIELRNRRTPDQPANVSALETRGDVLMLMGDVVSAQRTWTAALELGRRTLGNEHGALADIIRKLGFAESSLGDLGEARRLFEEAFASAKRRWRPAIA
jgi:tetratricopeptide (TPR) repeat protein